MPLKRMPTSSAEVLHVEVYAVPKRRRAEFRRLARKPIAFAREVTRKGGGDGPHFYRVFQQRGVGAVPRLGTLFHVRPSEDLWIEITFYPNRQRRRAITKEIWRSDGIAASLQALESLNSKRPGAWAIANATIEAI